MAVLRAFLTLFTVLTVACAAGPLEPLTESGSPQGTAPSMAPTVTEIVPDSGAVATLVRLTGTGFAPSGNTIRFGDGYIKDLASADGVSLEFSVPEALDLCPPNPTGPCPMGFPRVVPGTYSVAVLVAGETSNSVEFTVVDG